MREEEGASKIAAEGRYKRQDEFEYDPLKSKQNLCKNFCSPPKYSCKY